MRERTRAYSPIALTMKKMQMNMNWSRQVSTPLAGVPLNRLMQTNRRITSRDIRPGTIWEGRERNDSAGYGYSFDKVEI